MHAVILKSHHIGPVLSRLVVTMKAWVLWESRTCAFSLQTYWIHARSNSVALQDPSQYDGDDPVSAAQIGLFGVEHKRIQNPAKYIDASGAVSVPPTSELGSFCNQRKFLQHDCVSLNAETTPDFPAKKAMFYEEHLHEDAEVRLVVQGVGFFDVRNANDVWVRVRVEAGDMLVLPAGIYHRFSIDEQAGTLQAIRIFASNPKWIPIARPCDDNPARVAYRQRLALLKHL